MKAKPNCPPYEKSKNKRSVQKIVIEREGTSSESDREGEKKWKKKSRMDNALIFHGRQEKNHIISLFTSGQRLNKRTTDRRGVERAGRTTSGKWQSVVVRLAGTSLVTPRGRYEKRQQQQQAAKQQQQQVETTKIVELRVQSG